MCSEDIPVSPDNIKKYCWQKGKIIKKSEAFCNRKPESEKLVEAARYVFSLDRIPSELHFDEGHPKANILYVVDDKDTTLYYQYINEEEK